MRVRVRYSQYGLLWIATAVTQEGSKSYVESGSGVTTADAKAAALVALRQAIADTELTEIVDLDTGEVLEHVGGGGAAAIEAGVPDAYCRADEDGNKVPDRIVEKDI